MLGSGLSGSKGAGSGEGELVWLRYPEADNWGDSAVQEYWVRSEGLCLRDSGSD